MTGPKISVVMPVLNAVRFLESSIESVLGQSFGDFEFLIYDDGSSDGSIEIVQQYARQDSRVRFHCMPHRGYVPWLNEGARQAKGPLIARMDADDLCLPDRFLRQMEFLDEHPECVALGTAWENIDEEGDFLGFAYNKTSHEVLLEQLLSGKLGIICHPSVVMRRDALISIGGYRETYEPTEDLDLWFRLASIGQLGNLPEVLLRYRNHDGSVCNAQPHRQKVLVDKIVTEGRARFGLPPLDFSVWPKDLPDAYQRRIAWARQTLAAGNHKSARGHARIAMDFHRFSFGAWVLFAASYAPSWLLRALRTLKRYTSSRPPTLREASKQSGVSHTSAETAHELKKNA